MLTAVKAKKSKIEKVIKMDSILILVTENGKIKLEPYSDSIIRIVYTLNDKFIEEQSAGTIRKTQNAEWSYTENDRNVILKTEKINLEIEKETGAFTYYNYHGRRLTGEPKIGGKSFLPFESFKTVLDDNSIVEKIVTPDGVKEIVRDANKAYNETLYHTRLSFEWDENEALYGLGSQEEGNLNLRGTRQYIHQANLKIGIPVLISTNGYGILMDTYAPMIFNDNEYGSYLYSQASKELDYYFMYGENLDGVIEGYRTLTGKASLLPKWAFGYMQSLERYESQQEIIDTVMEYRRRQVPLDSIVLDWQSWEGDLWGQKTFDESRFPDPKAMTDLLHENGVHFMISIWPNMSKESQNYIQMKEENCLFQQSEIYNAFDEKARRLYWKQVNEGLFSKGIDSWWCDSSEPFTPEWNSQIKPEPDYNFQDFHNTAKIYMDETMTNAYPLMHAKAIYEGQRSVSDDKRVVNLTRGGYTGQQKYGTILWSGDTCAKWSTLKKQIPAGLNFCAAGMPYWTLDIGAFFVKQGHMWFWDGDYEEGCNDLGYRELYTRWYQYGSFLPVFRSHGTDTRREIWQFGDKGDMFYDSIEKFTRLRYQLMPYIYSLAAMVTLKDDTIMRLLAFDFQHDINVYDIKDQFMFGNCFMICPVTDPMYYGPNSTRMEDTDKVRTVYLPGGCIWYDFWTGEAFLGGQVVTANATIDRIPLYVKSGAIIPMAEVAQHTGAINEQEIDLQIYTGDNGFFTLYQDENDNYNYERGIYSTIEMTWNETEESLTLHKRKGSYPDMPKVIKFKIHKNGGEAKIVTYNGEEITITYINC
ncbi:MAG: TIM-barrel domain-containing protein [Mobilitalea sp.]